MFDKIGDGPWSLVIAAIAAAVTTGLSWLVRGRTPPNVLRGQFGTLWTGMWCFGCAVGLVGIGGVGGRDALALLFAATFLGGMGMAGLVMIWIGLMRRAVVTDTDIRINYFLRRPVTIPWAEVARLSVDGKGRIVIEMIAPDRAWHRLSTGWDNIGCLTSTAERLGIELAGFEQDVDEDETTA
jgi:hypothetical protein